MVKNLADARYIYMRTRTKKNDGDFNERIKLHNAQIFLFYSLMGCGILWYKYGDSKVLRNVSNYMQGVTFQ
jgi:hypothetical protein